MADQSFHSRVRLNFNFFSTLLLVRGWVRPDAVNWDQVSTPSLTHRPFLCRGGSIFFLTALPPELDRFTPRFLPFCLPEGNN